MLVPTPGQLSSSAEHGLPGVRLTDPREPGREKQLSSHDKRAFSDVVHFSRSNTQAIIPRPKEKPRDCFPLKPSGKETCNDPLETGESKNQSTRRGAASPPLHHESDSVWGNSLMYCSEKNSFYLPISGEAAARTSSATTRPSSCPTRLTASPRRAARPAR